MPLWRNHPATKAELDSGFRAQPVIDNQRQQAATTRMDPVVCQPSQRHAVRAAGDRHGQPRRPLERPQAPEQSSELVLGERRCLVSCSRRPFSHGSGPA